MKILVTGGAGFIGSHVCERLLSENCEVVCIDNFNDFYSPEIKRKNLSGLYGRFGFQLFEGDILDTNFLEGIFSANEFDSVIHLAARAGVRQSLLLPEIYAKVNVLGTLNILEQCRKRHIKKFLFASSSSVYGNLEKVPFLETDFVDFPVSPYAATKKSGELLCFSYHHLYQMDIACLRFFTVFGPRQRPEMAMHKFIYSILTHTPIVLYGDGRSSRDYTYIDDITGGIISCLKKIHGYEIVNLGNSSPVELNELVKKIEKYSGEKAQATYVDFQKGDVEKTFADIKKAKRLLFWEPKVTLDEGIKRTIAWQRKEFGI